MGIPYEVISDLQTLKKKLKKELPSSNIIAIGSAKTNGLIQALKPGIIQKSIALGFDWKSKMNQKLLQALMSLNIHTIRTACSCIFSGTATP